QPRTQVRFGFLEYVLADFATHLCGFEHFLFSFFVWVRFSLVGGNAIVKGAGSRRVWLAYYDGRYV
ncbi:MAG: hypothetical protein ABFS23_12095, partial [Pseudomonadota bacterium]